MEAKAPAIAFIDLGSNSVRLMIVRFNRNRSHTVLIRFKQMVRLGEGAFISRKLSEEAMNRTIGALRNMAEICRGYEAEEIVALATAAVRDADNGREFVERARRESGIAFDVVSGLEEARVIFLGVREALPPSDAATVFIDIGGGSTEVTAEVPGREPHFDSMRMGCVRLTNTFPRLSTARRVSQEEYNEAQEYVRIHSIRSLQKVRAILGGRPVRAVGSSGTIQNLAEIERRAPGDKRAETHHAKLALSDLGSLARKLCGMTLDERRQVPGINPQRADVIIGGAAILQTLMEELGAHEIIVSSRGLLDGMLRDYLERGRWGYLTPLSSAREESVLQLARSCHFDEKHSRWMSRIARSLFESSREAGLHSYGEAEMELLHYAALLHDIGLFLSFNNHNEHSRYLIENADLLGFHRSEIETIADVAALHRKGASNKRGNARRKDPGAEKTSATLGLFLRMAESLERSQQQTITDARILANGKKIILAVTAVRESPAEAHSICECRAAFKKRFGRTFELAMNTG